MIIANFMAIRKKFLKEGRENGIITNAQLKLGWHKKRGRLK